jgi:hypothetical protein
MSNFKNALSLYCQRNGFMAPQYNCTYPEDAVGYIVQVYVNGMTFCSGTEGTKRGAESKAAALALKTFGESLEGEMETGTNGNPVHGGQLATAATIAGEYELVSCGRCSTVDDIPSGHAHFKVKRTSLRREVTFPPIVCLDHQSSDTLNLVHNTVNTGC